MFDIVFISYDEPNADENWDILKNQNPYNFVYRVHGVEGILNAHIEAANVARTTYFYVVDGDNTILPEFHFDFEYTDNRSNYFWRAINPINYLTYGNGGVKLLHRRTILQAKEVGVDITTSLKKAEIVNDIASITNFNTSPFNTWRAAFRECTKLASRVITKQQEEETKARLKIWQTVQENEGEPYREECASGATAGTIFGHTYKNDLNELRKINDFEWLRKKYESADI